MGTRKTAHRVLAPVVAAGVLGVLPAPARADCFGTTDCPPAAGAALGASIVGFTGSIIGLLATAKVWDDGVKNPALSGRGQGVLYTFGGIDLALGGLAVGLQASVADPSCKFKSSCQFNYGFGGTTMALGVLALAGGIHLSATAARGRWYRAWLLPAPMVIATPRGSVPGLGVAGAGF